MNKIITNILPDEDTGLSTKKHMDADCDLELGYVPEVTDYHKICGRDMPARLTHYYTMFFCAFSGDQLLVVRATRAGEGNHMCANGGIMIMMNAHILKMFPISKTNKKYSDIAFAAIVHIVVTLIALVTVIRTFLTIIKDQSYSQSYYYDHQEAFSIVFCQGDFDA
jgi:hypothetical protein